MVTGQLKNFMVISVGGVDNAESKPAHRIYRVKLVFFNGNDTVFSGICLDQITLLFPKYLLQVKVEKCVRDGYQQIGGDIRNLQVVQTMWIYTPYHGRFKIRKIIS